MKRSISILLALAMILSLMPTVFAAGAQVKEGIVTETVGSIRLQFLSPSLVRIEEEGPKGFEDRNTFHIINRTEWDGDTVTIEESETEVVFTTSAAKVVVPTDSDITKCKIYDLDGSLIWEYQQIDSNKVDLPDFNEQVWSWQITDTPRIIPSEQGFAYVEGVTETLENNGWDLDNDAEDVYVFLPGNDHRQLREDFINLTGRTEMLPLFALGAWDSRWYTYTQATATAQYQGYHDRDLPLDVMIVDTAWRVSSGGTGYDINTDLFPDMEGFLAGADEANVQIMFNDHPEPSKDDNGNSNNVLNAEEVQFRQSNLTRILEMGMDGWWYDRNWNVILEALDGYTHEVMGMATYADAFKTVFPESRLFMMSNIDGNYHGRLGGMSNIAAHRYGVQWTGDTGETNGGQELILQEMQNAVTYGENSALPYVSTDIGGFYTASRTLSDSEYIRWVQYAALSPIFRLHVRLWSHEQGRMPWLRGEEVTDLYREYLNMRYRLLPVYYQLSHENYETGMPVVRPMTADYPEYAGADRDDQYLLGEDILVAPVLNAGRYASLPAEYFNGDVKAEYYNNKTLSGNPVLTTTESSINFNWGTSAPNNSVGADGYSARYTGSFTLPDDGDYSLTLSYDDGVRLYVDDELVLDSWKNQDAYTILDQVYEAGSTHTFVLEYFETSGSANLILGCVGAGEQVQERTVWIPEGRWINAFTGEEVYGPTTIDVDTTMALDDMPIFIKAGAVIPLADETLTTADSDWSHLTLDYYPSASVADTTEIYEDDTSSIAYQNGEYRTTELTAGFENGEAVLTIGAAQGEFEGELAFETRDWTIRVHGPQGWGELTAVTDGSGKAVEFTKIDRDASAMALENDGAAPDADVYEITLTGDIRQAQELRFTFASPAEDSGSGDEEPVVITGSPVQRRVVISEPTRMVNLSKEGTIDWLYAGYNSDYSVTRKSADEEYIRFTNSNTRMINSDSPIGFSWTDSADGSSASDIHKGQHTWTYDDPYQISVTATEEEQVLTLYLGGWQSYTRLEISDGTKGGTSVYHFGTFDGSYYEKVQIWLSAEEAADLNIRYSVYASKSNKGSPHYSASNAVFYGATLARAEDVVVSDPEMISAQVEVSEEMPTTVDLTAQGTGDWVFGYQPNGVDFIRKAGVEPVIDLSSEIIHNMTDYKTGFTWSDGTEPVPANSHRGIYTEGTIKVKIPVDTQQETLTLYVGGWRSQGTMEICDEAGNLLETLVFENSGGSYYRTVTIQVSAKEDTFLYIRYTRTANYTTAEGNVTLAAATFTGTVHDAPIAVEGVELDQTEAALNVGESLTLTASVTPEDADDPSVTWSSSDESVATVEDGVITALHSGTAVITAAAGDCSAECTVTVTFPNPFVDVEEKDYFFIPVLWAAEEHITAGDGDASTFNPDGDCTRAQVVTFLWRSAGEPEVSADAVNPFTDLTEDWYTDAVLWAVEQGITVGTSDTTFSPDESCTRAQVVTFLWRSAGSPEPESIPDFRDVEETEYYYKSVAWAVENGITLGTDPGLFSPDDTCTRAQIVTFLYRAMAAE